MRAFATSNSDKAEKKEEKKEEGVKDTVKKEVTDAVHSVGDKASKVWKSAREKLEQWETTNEELRASNPESGKARSDELYSENKGKKTNQPPPSHPDQI